MAVDSLRTHLVEELTDLLDAENQLTKALPKMAKASSSPKLKTAFERHLQETRKQIDRLDKALRQLGEKPRRKTCEAMEGLLSEGEEMMNSAPAGALRDAVMITAAQKVEHYEMASYGCVRTYAMVLGEPGVARLLEQTLKEEKAADSKLTTIAEGSVNEDASEEWQSQSSEGMMARGAEWVSNTLSSATRQFGRSTRRSGGSSGGSRKSSGRSSRSSSSRGSSSRRSSGRSGSR